MNLYKEKMKKKILILSVYPAPYRVELFKLLSKEFYINAFFENSVGDNRPLDWFKKDSYFLLDTPIGQQEYKEKIRRLKQYDIVAIYDYSTAEGRKLIFSCRLQNVPYVVNSDGVMLTAHGNVIKDKLKRFLLSGASAYLASGKMAKNYFLQLGADEDKIHIHTFSTLHSGDISKCPVGHAEKKLLREKLRLPSDKKLAIAVGRFIPLKRYLELIEVWKTMPDDYILLLIGGGEEEARYKKRIEENHIKNVILEGFHPKQELFEYYKAADVFVHPTSYDVWGLVVNEAMACGLPVIVSDRCVAGLELVQNGENGYLVELGNDVEMCEYVQKICENDEMHNMMAVNALKTIRPYTVDNMADIHINVFKEILGIV